MIEAAINELASKDQNPNVPYSPEEIARDAVACVRAGASIVHFHARDPETGAQLWHGVEAYTEAIKQIRSECDAIVYPTYPPGPSKDERIRTVLALVDDPDVGLEMATLDVGATNTGGVDADGQWSGGAYVNSHDDLAFLMGALSARGVAFSLGVRDVGHMRHVRSYLGNGLVSAPLVVKIFMAEDRIHGPYPNARGLMMYLDMGPRGEPWHWFTAAYHSPTAHTRVSMLAAAMGGHVRTGLGDNPVLNGKGMTNAEQVEMAVSMAHLAGRDVATPAEARQMMGMSASP